MPFWTKITRRTFLAGLGSTAIAGPALALSEGQARALVDKLVGEINTVIGSGKSEGAMIRDFERIFERYADVNIMAQYALGADGRSASSAQKRRFSDVFAGYIARKYGKRFREFIGGRIEVRSARAIRAGYEIKTTAFLRGSSPFEVTFLVSDRSGSNKFFNMFIEGVNLLLTERTEIGALIDRNGGNIDAMIQDLRRMG
ncbi:MAG: ABC transporter substrate-binding protein [Pseudomonadota bacterium]